MKVEVLQDYAMMKRGEAPDEAEQERRKRFEGESLKRIPEALRMLEEFGDGCFGRVSLEEANYRIQTGGSLILLTGRLGGSLDTHSVELYLGSAADDFFAWYLTVREMCNPVEILHFSTTDLSEDGLKDGLKQAAAAIDSRT